MQESPNIIVSSRDLGRLEAILNAGPKTGSPGSDALLAELARATVLEPEEMPSTVVTMNSTVRFVIEPTGKEFELTLSYPKDVGEDGDRISVTAPIGSALLGLSVGQSIGWPLPGGRTATVRIIDVVYQPERAGDYHR